MTEKNLQMVKPFNIWQFENTAFGSTEAAHVKMKDLYNEHQFSPRESHPH